MNQVLILSSEDVIEVRPALIEEDFVMYYKKGDGTFSMYIEQPTKKLKKG